MDKGDLENAWWLAERAMMPKQEVMRRALKLMRLLVDNLDRGNDVLIRGRGARQWEDQLTVDRLLHNLSGEGE
jgi:hypothetical protein